MSSEGDVGGDVITNIKEERESSSERVSNLRDRDAHVDVYLLPEKIKKRLRALKTLQVKQVQLEAKFFQDVHFLECRYNRDYKELNNKRNQIVCGHYEPSEEELYPEEPLLDICSELPAKGDDQPDGPGIPNFWLTIFRNVALLNDLIQPEDEPILKYLHDIKVEMLENPMGFRLEFHFLPNDYFSNRVLTKEYEMKCQPDEDDPFTFEGPEIFNCKGCKIDWYNGKDTTVKTVQKRQKHRSKNTARTVTKTVETDSFFNFFNPPVVPKNGPVEMDSHDKALFAADFELGHYIRERIVPHAVLYFTGEALDDEEFETSSSESVSTASTSVESPSGESEPQKE